MTDAERAAFDADLIADPQKYKKLWGDKARAENPQMTEHQLDMSWRQLCHQFGLESGLPPLPKDEEGKE
jgi:hypothetical protein